MRRGRRPPSLRARRGAGTAEWRDPEGELMGAYEVSAIDDQSSTGI